MILRQQSGVPFAPATSSDGGSGVLRGQAWAGERLAHLVTRPLGPLPITLAEWLLLVPFLVLVAAALSDGDRATAALLLWLVVVFCALLLVSRLLARPASGGGPRRAVHAGMAVVSALFFLLAGFTTWLFVLLGLWAILAAWRVRSTAASAAAVPSVRLLRAALPAPIVAGVVAAAVGRWLIGAVIYLAAPKHQVDFAIYYAAALALHHNPQANIYDLALLRETARMYPGAFVPEFPYLYPPVLALLMQPLTLVPPRAAALIWTVLNLLLWLVCTILLVDWLDWPLRRAATAAERLPGGLARRWGALPAARCLAVALAAVLSLGYVALDHTVFIGQITGVVLCLILLVPWLLRRRLDALAGAALALAVAIKLFPVVLIAYFVARRQWRVVAGAVGGLTLLGAGALAFGISPAQMVRGILDNGAAQQRFANNQALSQVPLWIALELGGKASTLTTVVGYAVIAAVALVFAGVLLGVWRSGSAFLPANAPADGRVVTRVDWLGYSWVICTMVLVAPITWEHHDAWLLPAIAAGLGYGLSELAYGVRARDGRLKLELVLVEALVLAYLLTMQALPFNYDSNHFFALGPYLIGHPLRPVIMLLRPLSALLVWGSVGALWLRQTRHASSTAYGREAIAATGAALHPPTA